MPYIHCTHQLYEGPSVILHPPHPGNWVSVKWLTQDGQESQEVSWPLGLELWTTTAGALQLSSNQPHTVARGFFLNYHQDSLSSSTQLFLQASSSGIQSSSSNRKVLPLLWEAAPPHLFWTLFPLVCFAVILIGAVIHLKLWLCLVWLTHKTARLSRMLLESLICLFCSLPNTKALREESVQIKGSIKCHYRLPKNWCHTAQVDFSVQGWAQRGLCHLAATSWWQCHHQHLQLWLIFTLYL